MSAYDVNRRQILTSKVYPGAGNNMHAMDYELDTDKWHGAQCHVVE